MSWDSIFVNDPFFTNFDAAATGAAAAANAGSDAAAAEARVDAAEARAAAVAAAAEARADAAEARAAAVAAAAEEARAVAAEARAAAVAAAALEDGRGRDGRGHDRPGGQRHRQQQQPVPPMPPMPRMPRMQPIQMDPFNQTNFIMQGMANEGGGNDAHSFYHSSVYTYASDGQGAPKVYQAAREERRDPAASKRPKRRSRTRKPECKKWRSGIIWAKKVT